MIGGEEVNVEEESVQLKRLLLCRKRSWEMALQGSLKMCFSSAGCRARNSSLT